ncbi:spore coat U domain-containing protein [Enterobacter sp. 168J2]|uniref:Csu type fimbrial protein n=1 Tax=Enterobacter sp. 168J2 TaxID=3077758 RepID=UPI00124A8C5C|nr:spore coat U domain-containing protein [Enterobacter sp. 168J2]HBU6133719.1 spore coat protein U domain-containing protein [Enterobacter cloacae]
MSLRAPLLLLLVLSMKAMAAACWITSPAVINFGSVVAGNAASTNTEVKFSCQADNNGTMEYLNVCLSSIDTPPFQMLSNGDQEGKQYTLLFRLLNGVARSQELGPASRGDLIQQTLTAQSNASVSGSFPLIAILPAGQNQLPAYHYYNYNMNLRIAWHSATRQEALQNCSDGSAEGEQVQGGTNAQAEIGQGCFIERVTPLNFGTLNSTATLRPTRSTATLTTRCPAGTAFTLAMGNGNHASGTQRQLCNDEGQCLRYGLWQDAAATQRWGDWRSGDALHVTNPTGGTQSFTVYGEVPAQPLSGTGEFIDDVIITLTY